MFYTGWGINIEPRQVVRISDKSATVLHKQFSLTDDNSGKLVERRQNDVENFHATWELAKQAIIRRLDERLKHAEEHLQETRALLKKAEELAP